MERDNNSKYWSFRNELDDEVWRESYSPGDTPKGMMDYWHDFMADEEYVPTVASVELLSEEV